MTKLESVALEWFKLQREARQLRAERSALGICEFYSDNEGRRCSELIESGEMSEDWDDEFPCKVCKQRIPIDKKYRPVCNKRSGARIRMNNAIANLEIQERRSRRTLAALGRWLSNGGRK